jgi:cell division protein FtsZ
MLFDLPKHESSIIKVLGVGGGGSNAVAHMFKQGIKGVDFAVCNTDAQAMESSPVPIRIQLGPELTEGMGAGAQPEVGKQSCIESIDEVRSFLTGNTKMLFITAGMGGGTGTGAAPIIAKAARDMDILTVAIVTLPFDFEGKKRVGHADEGLEQLKKNVDCLLVISNERLFSMFEDMSLEEAFAEADSVLTTAAKGIAEIITLRGTVNVDFKDVNTVMRNSGKAIMGNAIVSGEDRAMRAVKGAINSPLLEDNNIRGAKHILLNIYTGTKKLGVKEIATITNHVREAAGEDTNVIFGSGTDEELGDKLSVTIIATGFERMITHKDLVKTVVTVELDDPVEGNTRELETPQIIDIIEEDTDELIETEVDDVAAAINNYAGRGNNTVEFDYNPGNVRQQKIEEERKRDYEQERAKRQNRREAIGQSLDDPHTISEMENIPAYKRRKINLDEIGLNENSDRLSIDDGARNLN